MRIGGAVEGGDVEVGFNTAGLKVVGTIVTGAVVVGVNGAGGVVDGVVVSGATVVGVDEAGGDAGWVGGRVIAGAGVVSVVVGVVAGGAGMSVVTGVAVIGPPMAITGAMGLVVGAIEVMPEGVNESLGYAAQASTTALPSSVSEMLAEDSCWMVTVALVAVNPLMVAGVVGSDTVTPVLGTGVAMGTAKSNGP